MRHVTEFYLTGSPISLLVAEEKTDHVTCNSQPEREVLCIAAVIEPYPKCYRNDSTRIDQDMLGSNLK